MRWDRKLTVFAAGAVLLVALLAAGLLFLTVNRMGNVSERIAGAAGAGAAFLTAAGAGAAGAAVTVTPFCLIRAN